MKKWIAKVQLYWDASCVVSIEVKANTERKARIFAEKKAIKEYGWDSPKILSIKEVEE